MSLYDSKKYREERAGVIQEIQTLASTIKTENRQATGDELTKFSNLEAARQDLDSKIKTSEAIERSEALTVDIVNKDKTYRSNPVVTQRDKDLALRGWLVSAAGRYDLQQEAYQDAMTRCGINPQNSALALRAGQDKTTTAGGYTADDAVVIGVEKYLKDYSGILQAAKILNTSHGNDLRVGTIDDTASVASKVAENTATTTEDLTFGSVTFKSTTYRTQIFPISYELIRDSSVGITDLVSEALGTRLGRTLNNTCTLGDGNGDPHGVVVASSKGADGAETALIGYPDLVDLYVSVDAAYRSSPSCVWMVSSDAFGEMLKLVDGNDRPLIQSSAVNSPFDMLLGKRVIVNPDMADVGTGSKSVLFGDMSKFVVRRIDDVSIMVAKERFIESLAVGVFGFASWDSRLVNTAAVKHLLTK